MSSSTNETDLEPLIDVVVKHNATVLNGHDHCLVSLAAPTTNSKQVAYKRQGHYYNNNTNFVLTGAAGYPQAGDCNNGTALGPYAKFLAANPLTAANGFVTMDISKSMVNVEYYVRDMQFDNGDLYSVHYDLAPSYSFQITTKST